MPILLLISFATAVNSGEQYVTTGTVTSITSSPSSDTCTVTSWGGHWDLPWPIQADYGRGKFKPGDFVEVYSVKQGKSLTYFARKQPPDPLHGAGR